MRERLAELTARYGCPAAAETRLAQLLRTLAGDALAPTPIRDPERAVEVHVADSLAGLEVDALWSARQIADVGSGAGFPGLPLACALAHATVHLVESTRRKAAYLERTARAIGLDNANVVSARVEQWDDGGETQDAVLARALAPLAVIAEYAAPLLREGGIAVAWKGRRERAEEQAAAAAARTLGLEPADVLPVAGPEGAQARHLYLYLKVRATPERFPRRPGIAAKRPL